MPHEALNNYKSSNLIGCGPYMIKKEMMREECWTLEKNPDYSIDTLHKPQIDNIKIYFNVSTDKELQMFSEGNLDLTFNVSQELVSRFMESNVEGFEKPQPDFLIIQRKGLEDSKFFTMQISKIEGLTFDYFGIVRFNTLKMKK